MHRHWSNRWTLLIGTGATLITLMAPAARAADRPERQTTWLGVYTQALTNELRDGLDYSGKGVLVNRVVPDSPADRAGIEKGDVIISFNSRTLTDPDNLASMVREMKPGQAASIGIVRDGSRRTVSAKLAARPDVNDDEMPQMGDDERDSERGPEGDSDEETPEVRTYRFKGTPGAPAFDFLRVMGRGRLGVRIESLNPDLGAYFDVPDGRGVLVLEVIKGTPAERAGIKAGDVITRVGDRNVSDAEDLTSALEKEEGHVTLTVVRKSGRRTIDAELESQPRAFRWNGPNGPMGLNDNDRAVIRRLGRGADDSDLRKQMQQLREELRSLREEIRKQRN
jgi:predicted metalloprotease with PDZ domain